MKFSTLANICMSGAGGVIASNGNLPSGVLIVMASIFITLQFNRLEK